MNKLKYYMSPDRIARSIGLATPDYLGGGVGGSEVLVEFSLLSDILFTILYLKRTLNEPRPYWNGI